MSDPAGSTFVAVIWSATILAQDRSTACRTRLVASFKCPFYHRPPRSRPAIGPKSAVRAGRAWTVRAGRVVARWVAVSDIADLLQKGPRAWRVREHQHQVPEQ